MPLQEVQPRQPAGLNAVLHAVFEECRYKSLVSSCYLARIMDVHMCAIEAAHRDVVLPPREPPRSEEKADHDQASVENVLWPLHDAASNASSMSMECPSLFMPVRMDDDDDDEDMGEAADSLVPRIEGADGRGCASEIYTKPAKKTTVSEEEEEEEGVHLSRHSDNQALTPGRIAVVDTLSSHFHGRWECGTFGGKRIYLDIGEACLGRGAMAAVYEAWIAVMDMVEGNEVCLARVPVAIKQIVYNIKKKVVRNMYERAAQLRLDLVHPGIVRSYFAGMYLPYMDRFYLPGDFIIHSHLVLARSTEGSVADVLKRAGPFPESEVKRCVAEMLLVLECLHEQHHRVHNDVKPHNILLFDDPTIHHTHFRYQITDFAAVMFSRPLTEMAREVADNEWTTQDISMAGGTATYMSPEGCLGLSMLSSNDVWSLGITAFHMITGTLPWSTLERQHPYMIMFGYRQKFTPRSLFARHVPAMRQDTGVVSPGLRETGQPTEKERNAQEARGAGLLSASTPPSNSDAHTPHLFHEMHREFGPILDALDEVVVSKEFRDFLALCLTENPMERPTCRQLRSHAFVADLVKDLDR